MELFAAPGACSFGAHVIIRELELPLQVNLVGFGVEGSRIYAVNPLGRVPAILLDDGSLLTENTAILPFLADLRPGTDLFAPSGSIERALIQSWIGYINSELHAATLRSVNRPQLYSPDSAAQASIRQTGMARLRKVLAPLEDRLAHHPYLVGDRFTIADAYFGLFAGLVAKYGSDLSDLTAIQGYSDRYEARPSVLAARAFEVEGVAA